MADVVEIFLKLRDVRQFITGADQASKAVAGVGKEADKAGKKTKSSSAGLFKFAGGAAAIYGATRFLKTSIGAASDLNEEINKTQVVFGESAAGIVKWSDDSATALLMSKEEALAATGVLGNMLVPMGFARDRAAQMSQRMVKLAADMASFNNASPQDTLQALRSGLAGQARPLRVFGVFLSAARVQAEAMTDGIVKNVKNLPKLRAAQFAVSQAISKTREEMTKHGKGSVAYRKAVIDEGLAEGRLKKELAGRAPVLTAAQKAQATYNIILKDTKDAQGDVARTSGGLANRQRILAARWKDMQENIGNQLLPTVIDIAGIFLKLLKLLEPLTKNTRLFKLAIAGLTTVFVAYKLAMMAARIQTVFFEASVAPVAAIVFAIVIAVAALAIGFYLLYKHVGWFRDAVNATFDWIKQHWRLLVGILLGPIAYAILKVIENFGLLKKTAGDVVDWIVHAFHTVTGAISDAAHAIGHAFTKAFETVKGVVRGALNFVIRGWNRLHFTAPSVSVFGHHFGGFTVGVKGIPELAKGGRVRAAGTALVGERGPELLTLPPGALVSPLPPTPVTPFDFSQGQAPIIEVHTQLVVDRRVLARAIAQYSADKLARR